MLKLTNIKIDKTVISCDYYPEHTGLKGHISFDVEKDEVVDYEPSAYPANGQMYKTQVMAKLWKLYKNKDDIPVEVYSVWY